MHQNGQTSSGAEPASHLKGADGSFPWGEVTISQLCLVQIFRIYEIQPLPAALQSPSHVSTWHAQEQLHMYMCSVLEGYAVKRWWPMWKNCGNFSVDWVSPSGDLNQKSSMYVPGVLNALLVRGSYRKSWATFFFCMRTGNSRQTRVRW